MKRSIGVTLFSSCFIAMSLTTLLYDYIPVGSALYLLLNPMLMILGKTIGTMVAAGFLLLGVSLFMLKEIARKIFISIQSISILGGVYMATQAAAWGGGVIALIFGSIIFNIFPIIFIIFFTRPKVKNQFK